MKPTRAVIFICDVMNLLGLKYGAARLLLIKIKESLGKKESQFITIKEFSEYTGIEEAIVIEFMVD